MSLSAMIRGLFSFVLAFGVGAFGLYIMFFSEKGTAHNFKDYFHWALGGGLVFLAVSIAYICYNQQDIVTTSFDESGK